MVDMVDPQLMQSPQAARHPMEALTQDQSGLMNAVDPSWGYDLNLLSHAASHVASTGHNNMGGLPQMDQVTQEQMAPLIASHEPQYHPMLSDNYRGPALNFETPDLGDPMQDFTVFLDSVGLSSDWHSGIFNSIEPPIEPMPALSPNAKFGDHLPIPTEKQNGSLGDGRSQIPMEESNSFSRFGSRLPSLQPESRETERIDMKDFNEPNSKTRPAWEISDSDRQSFISKLESFVSILPKGFIAPSRHSLSRYLAGYINGFHEHLPFIHVPTLSVATIAPELVLALAAVGAQYRFENSRGIELFYAAKAVVMEQIRRRDERWVPQVSWHRSASSVTSPGDFQGAGTPYPYMPAGGSVESNSHMGSIQALLLLTAFATWERHKELLREALAFQSILARLVREDGLSDAELAIGGEDLSWQDWIKQEGDKRTKLIVYCFFNLHSITWDVPPLILNAEMKLSLPDPANEWKASNAAQWKRLHRQNNTTPEPFNTTFMRLFTKSANTNPGQPVSPLGNYVLIHALIQQIYFARQLSTFWPTTNGSSLRQEDLGTLEQALSTWKTGWKRAPESSLDPQNPNGPVAFTSTALLGLAYIRLYVDMGPLRHLETRNPIQIAIALHESPQLERSPRLIMALLHSAHALSIPIRLGIDFVARTQTFFWSIQHSLCSLECAFLLSKWLAVVPSANTSSTQAPPFSDHERKLLVWVRSMLDETEMGLNNIDSNGDRIDSNGNLLAKVSSRDILEDELKIKHLSVAVVRVWAKTFKGNTSWAIVDLIGSALEIYADMLEKDIG